MFNKMDFKEEINLEDDADISPIPPSPKKRKKQKCYRKKIECEWSHENNLKLIQEIETRRSLWDVRCAEYKLPKTALWEEVAKAINMPVNDCKGKWSNLRTTFNSNLNKIRRKKSGQATNESITISWKYFKQMMFLEANKVLQSTQSTSSLESNSALDDHSFLKHFGKCDVPPRSGTGNHLKHKVEISTPLLTSADTSESINLKHMAVEALQSNRSQIRDPNTSLCEYMASELQSLTREQSAYARSQLRIAFNEIIDQVSLMSRNY